MHLEKPIVLLVDYRGAFNSKASNSRNFGSLDLDQLKRAFDAQECAVEIRAFPSLDLRREDFEERWVVLTSSEDRTSYINHTLRMLRLRSECKVQD